MEDATQYEEDSHEQGSTAVLSNAFSLALADKPVEQRDEVLEMVVSDKARAIATAARLIRGSRNTDTVAHLSHAGSLVNDPALIYGLGLALSGVGGARARHAALELAQRLHPVDRVGLEWLALGMTPMKVIERFSATGLAEDASDIDLPLVDDSLDGRIYDLREIFARLHHSGLVLYFRFLPRERPPRHDNLFAHMIRLTQGMVEVPLVEVSQTVAGAAVKGVQAGELRYTWNAKRRVIPLKIEHHQFDAASLVSEINSLFREMQLRHRLIPLLAPNGHMCLIFGEPQRLLPLLHELKIPLDMKRLALWRRNASLFESEEPNG